MVSVGGFHDLDPLDHDLVLGTVMLGLESGKLGALSETVDTSSPVDVELKLLLDLVSDDLENILSKFFRVVRDFGLELASVLVDALDLCLIESDLEVVGEKLELLSGGFGVSFWLLWEESKGT